MLEALPPSQPVSSSPMDSRLTVLDTANIYEEHFTSSMPICFPYMFLKLENKIYVFCLYTYGLWMFAVPVEVRRGHWISPLELSVVLSCGSSGGAVSAPNPWAISPCFQIQCRLHLVSQLLSWPRAGSNPSSLPPGWGSEEEKGRGGKREEKRG